jgi:FkbM family methyltransferase
MDKLFRHITPKRALDIGAHVGGFTRSLLAQFPNCQVVMVEANSHCEPHLQTVGCAYEIVALCDYNGQALLYMENDNQIGTGASLYKENTVWYSKGEKQTVTTKRLDDCNYFDGAPIDLIKMDVQGAELDIIKGGGNTIKNATFVLMETSLLQYNQEAPLIDSVVEKMVSMDFCMWDIVEYHKLSDGTIFQLDILFKNLR